MECPPMERVFCFGYKLTFWLACEFINWNQKCYVSWFLHTCVCIFWVKKVFNLQFSFNYFSCFIRIYNRLGIKLKYFYLHFFFTLFQIQKTVNFTSVDLKTMYIAYSIYYFNDSTHWIHCSFDITDLSSQKEWTQQLFTCWGLHVIATAKLHIVP